MFTNNIFFKIYTTKYGIYIATCIKYMLNQLNYNSIIGHDVVVNSNCFIGPGVILTGRCSIGENVLLGAGTICIPGIQIGHNSKIAAGIVATSNINANTTMLLRQNIVKI